jgi:hypothetical protein
MNILANIGKGNSNIFGFGFLVAMLLMSYDVVPFCHVFDHFQCYFCLLLHPMFVDYLPHGSLPNVFHDFLAVPFLTVCCHVL